jgi:hypothetical protein
VEEAEGGEGGFEDGVRRGAHQRSSARGQTVARKVALGGKRSSSITIAQYVCTCYLLSSLGGAKRPKP